MSMCVRACILLMYLGHIISSVFKNSLYPCRIKYLGFILCDLGKMVDVLLSGCASIYWMYSYNIT